MEGNIQQFYLWILETYTQGAPYQYKALLYTHHRKAKKWYLQIEYCKNIHVKSSKESYCNIFVHLRKGYYFDAIKKEPGVTVSSITYQYMPPIAKASISNIFLLYVMTKLCNFHI